MKNRIRADGLSQSDAGAPLIMGIVNVTPDSFSDGGAYLDPSQAIEHGLRLAARGATILDVGGESTRPGAVEISIDDELARVLPVVEGLFVGLSQGEAAAKHARTEISIDTRKSAVARQCFAAGARIWNDVSALTFNSDSLETAAHLMQYDDAQVILMHAQGDPDSMQDNPQYDDVIQEIYDQLAARIAACAAAGVDPGKIVVDPGIGFGKTLRHNLALFAELPRFKGLGAPVLVGASRKRFIAALDPDSRDDPAAARIGGSIAAAIAAYDAGADILRVHDVDATRQAIAVWRGLKSADIDITESAR